MSADFISGRVLMLVLIVVLLLVAMAVIVAAALMQKPTRQWRVQWQENTADLRRAGIKTLKGEPVQPRMVPFEDLINDPTGVNTQTLVLHPVRHGQEPLVIAPPLGAVMPAASQVESVYDQDQDRSVRSPLDQIDPVASSAGYVVEPAAETIEYVDPAEAEEDEYEAEEIEFHLPAPSENDDESEDDSSDVDYFAAAAAWFAATRERISDRYQQWSAERSERRAAAERDAASAEDGPDSDVPEGSEVEKIDEVDPELAVREAVSGDTSAGIPPPPPPPSPESEVPEAKEVASVRPHESVEEDRELVIVDWLDEADLTKVQPEEDPVSSSDADSESIEESTAALLSEWLRDFTPTADPPATESTQKWREYIPQLSEAEISQLRPSAENAATPASSDLDES